MMLVIYGPTATGKTALATTLAKKLNGEIISADSRQVYKGLDIGTGKVSFDSKVQKHEGYWIVDGVKIHGFDLVDPEENFSAADFLKFVSKTIAQISKTNKLPIVVGGTGFYIKALTSGIDSLGIPQNQKLRKKLEKLSSDELYQKLRQLDPLRANSMNESDRANPRRLIRAIEIASYTLKPQPTSHMLNDYIIVGLTAPNNYLYKRSDKWLETRLEHSLLEEVQSLFKAKVNPEWLEGLGLEYRWLSRYLLGRISRQNGVERLKGDIHSFIRRQKTWFLKFKGIKLFDISQPNWQHKLEKTVKDWYHTDSNGGGKTNTKN